MILSRSLTILLSFCFALISLPAEKAFASALDCPRPSKDKPLEERVTYLLEKSKALAAEQRYKRAEVCLQKAITLDPKNRDLAYTMARLKAWQGEHDEADAIARAYTDDDPESLTFRSDLARYRAADVKKYALHYRAALGAMYGVETQQQSISTIDADGSFIKNRKSLSLGVSSLERDFGPIILKDTVYRLGLGFGIAGDPDTWYLAQETSLNFATAPDAKFSSKETYALRHMIFLTEAWSFYGEIGTKSYPDLYVRTLQVGASLLKYDFRYQARGFVTSGKTEDLAAGAFVGYDGHALHPEVYLIGGRDAASRPYITRTDSAAFLTIGGQVTLFLNEQWKLRALAEDRQEKGYRLKGISLSVIWTD
ncbi:MAG: tetratricopeptide repeat protein [Proteobacteria bacterium]|nr:MAG: tetratricopeptide repeat protein [Pseudomonadota bacterium]